MAVVKAGELGSTESPLELHMLFTGLRTLAEWADGFIIVLDMDMGGYKTFSKYNTPLSVQLSNRTAAPQPHEKRP